MAEILPEARWAKFGRLSCKLSLTSLEQADTDQQPDLRE
jgi:hypothetical protein